MMNYQFNEIINELVEGMIFVEMKCIIERPTTEKQLTKLN
jgi:hypothetical protein